MYDDGKFTGVLTTVKASLADLIKKGKVITAEMIVKFQESIVDLSDQCSDDKGADLDLIARARAKKIIPSIRDFIEKNKEQTEIKDEIEELESAVNELEDQLNCYNDDSVSDEVDSEEEKEGNGTTGTSKEETAPEGGEGGEGSTEK